MLPRLLPLLWLLAATPTWADTLDLKNGDRLTGVVVQKLGDRVSIATRYAGLVEVLWAEIDGIEVAREITVVHTDGRQLSGTVSKPEAGHLRIDGTTLALAEVHWLNPPSTGAPKPDTPSAVDYSGNLRAGAVATTGNSDTATVNLQAELVARKDKNRLTAGLISNFARVNGRQTGENYNGYLRYDRFRGEHWFGSANLALTHDKFTDIQLRTTLGLGLGYQFWEHAKGKLSTEVGLNYVREDRDGDGDEDFPAMRWASSYEKWFGTHTAQIFFNHELLQALSDGSDRIVTARTGVRVPIYKQWTAGFEAHLNWDYSPVPGRESTDINYIMSLGYRL